jgi:cytochrome c oxidase subunit II
MNPVVISIAVVLILAILVLIFRIQTLVSVMRGSYRKRGGISNRINAILFIVFFIVGFGSFFWFSIHADYHLPPSSSEHGVHTDFMFWVTMGILVFAFFVTHIFLFFFPYRYQYEEGKKAFFYPENHRLEIVWTIIPAIVMAMLVYYGWKTWADIMKKEPADSIVIEVMGQQFNWLARYPGADGKLGNHNFKLIDATNQFGLDLKDPNGLDDFAPREIHIPKGKPVLLRIRAKDVLHSVYLPHFRVKMDAVPGMPTKFWFVANQTTAEMRSQESNPNFNFELACAELCGRGHFTMRYVLVVDEPEDYEKWYKAQEAWAVANKDYVLNNKLQKLPDELKRLLPSDTSAVSMQ